MPLRLVLMGTGGFAIPAFRALLESEHTVVAVVTQPDRTGQGHHQHMNVVRQLAEQYGVPVLQPERASRPDFLEALRALQADVFIVAAYGQILKPELLAIPRLGAYNLHGSLLPRHRGAAPVQYAVWKGDRETGVTMFRIEPALDSGPMAGRVTTPIGARETAGELMQRLAELCVPLTLETVRQLEAGTIRLEPQDPAAVTLAPKITREAGIVDWSATRQQVDCQIRAMQPWPKASTVLRREGHPDVRCLIQLVDPSPAQRPDAAPRPGLLQTRAGALYAGTGDGWVEILKLQVEGRKAADAKAFLNGFPLQPGDHFL